MKDCINELSCQNGIRDEVSAFIVCCNEEDKIERCLKSIEWCDEIIIVDSGSKDNTLEICKKYTDKIYYHEWIGFKEQKEYALSLCTKKWVMNLDADEEVSEELKKYIIDMLQRSKKGEAVSDGYNINRLVFFLNRWWKCGGWYPEYRLRLMKKEKTTWSGVNPHEKAVVNGEISKIQGDLYHYSFDTIFDQLHTINNFSSISAQELHKRNKKCHIWNVVFNPLIRFIKFYIFKRGFLGGAAGFIVSINEAFFSFLKYAKLWEMDNSKYENKN